MVEQVESRGTEQGAHKQIPYRPFHHNQLCVRRRARRSARLGLSRSTTSVTSNGRVGLRSIHGANLSEEVVPLFFFF